MVLWDARAWMVHQVIWQYILSDIDRYQCTGVDGWSGSPALTEYVKDKAAKLPGELLADIRFDTVYSSGLESVYDTMGVKTLNPR